MNEHLCGAVIGEALKPLTDAVCLALASAGVEPLFADAQPGLKGFGEGKSVLLQDAEVELFGKTLPSWMQRRGTCTEQGTGRAACDSLYWAIRKSGGDSIGSPVEIASETLYGIGRVQIGKGQFGKASPWGVFGNQARNDGCAGSMVALAAHDYGLLKRGVYDSIDLSKPREDLAILWGNNGTPASLIAESTAYKIDACMQVKSVDELRDGIAAGYAATVCGPFCAEGQRDANGMAPLQDCGGHCMEVCGEFVDIHGDLIFQVQNSWGTMGPQGGGTFKLKDGREVQPREGSCGVRPEQFKTYLSRGEIWLIGAPLNPWRNADLKPSDLAV